MQFINSNGIKHESFEEKTFAVLRRFRDFLLVAPCRLALHQKKVSSLLGELLKREVVLGEAEKALLESALCKMDKFREEIIRSGSCSYCLMLPFLFFFLLFICVIILICDLSLSVTNIPDFSVPLPTSFLFLHPCILLKDNPAARSSPALWLPLICYIVIL